MGPRNAYKDMLDIEVSLIACVNMNHQNQLEQIANGAMFATLSLCWISPAVTSFPCGRAGGMSTHDNVQQCGIKESASPAVQLSYMFC
jgi:hypothetical protein